MHFRLSAFGAAPTPDPSGGWERLRPMLRDRRTTPIYRLHRQARRAIAATVAAAVFTAGVSLAGVPMGRVVVDAWRGFVQLVQGGQSPERPIPSGNGPTESAEEGSPVPPEDKNDLLRRPASERDSNGTNEDDVVVAAVNDAPTAQDYSVTTDEDVPVIISVLTSDTDTDGDPLRVTAGKASNGSVNVGADGMVTYTPDQDFADTDSFTYTVSDGSTVSTAATVVVRVKPVNDPPVPEDDHAVTPEETPVTILVLDNDTDVDEDDLTVAMLTPPSNGSAAVEEERKITYTPNTDFVGTDTLAYTVSDGTGDPVEASVTVEVTPVNDPPVSSDDQTATEQNTAVTTAVLANDTDVDGEALKVTSAAQPENGGMVVNADGTITYTPDPEFVGNDAFSYSVVDGSGASATATVSVTVGPLQEAKSLLNSLDPPIS